LFTLYFAPEESTMKVQRIFVSACAAVLLLWSSFWVYQRFVSPTPNSLAGSVLATSTAKNLLPEEQRNIEIYKSVSPAVVNITSTVLKYDFFHNPIPSEGSGSGVILTATGYILTNSHVIEGARQLEVTLIDGKTLPAKLIGSDPSCDTALIQIQNKAPLPFVTIGNSEDLEVGQNVYAIGNPFGLNSTLTTGVISSLNRSLKAPNGRLIEHVIQTDAAINPGNSGGPLLDSSGHLIGINTAIFSPSGANAGIGFAIPASRAKKVADDLIRVGRVVHSYLGTTISLELSPRISQVLKLPVNHGVLVGEVYPDSPAQKAGLRGGNQVVEMGNHQLLLGGDILTEMDGKGITSANAFLGTIESKKPGDKMTLTVYRDGKLIKVTVVLKERPENI